MRSRNIVFTITALAAALSVAACDKNSPSGPTQTLTVVSTAALDGYVTSAGTVQTAGGGPVTGDLEAVFPGVAYRQFFSFDLTGLPANASVDTATLRLYQASTAGAPFTSLGNVVVDHLDYGGVLAPSAFDLLAITSNIGILSSNTTVEYKTLAVTTAVKTDVSLGRVRSQFRLRMSIIGADNDGASDNVTFSDTELSCCPGQVPQLVIIYR